MISYIANILVQEAGQGGSGDVHDIFDAMLIRAAGNRNELNMERGRHREEVEELGGGINTLATKLRQREEELESLRANVSSYIGNILVQESGQGSGGREGKCGCHLGIGYQPSCFLVEYPPNPQGW